jgi:hypothetical protein
MKALCWMPIFCCCFLAAGEELRVGGRRLTVQPLHEEDFEGPLSRWRFDGRGRVWAEDGRLQMDAGRFESTAWFTEEMEGDLAITWEAHILSPAGDRNVNLFFLATASDGGDVLTVPFAGQYSEYHKFPNYIWTLTSTHTRLRRNPGFQILSEDTATVTESNMTYRLALTVERGRIRCYIGDRLIHDVTDPDAHRRGKLAFRTFRTRLWWDNLRVYRIGGDECLWRDMAPSEIGFELAFFDVFLADLLDGSDVLSELTRLRALFAFR